MFDNFTEFTVSVGQSKDDTQEIYGVKSATNGPPILLLHGFPQTHHIWHEVAPELTSHFTVIAIDLRGYGRSFSPPASDSHAAYAKSAMARDCIAVMDELKFDKFNVLAHDRGARVAHKLCVDFPDRVDKCMLLDICPTLSMYEQTDQKFATAYWHWFFFLQPTPFPETAMFKETELFMQRFFPGDFFSTAALTEYKNQFQNWDSVVGMCEDYRAGASIDLDEARADRDRGRKIKCDLRVLWGKKGVVEMCFDAIKEWKQVCDGEVTGEAVDSGHYIAEELTSVLLQHVRSFFGTG